MISATGGKIIGVPIFQIVPVVKLSGYPRGAPLWSGTDEPLVFSVRDFVFVHRERIDSHPVPRCFCFDEIRMLRDLERGSDLRNLCCIAAHRECAAPNADHGTIAFAATLLRRRNDEEA